MEPAEEAFDLEQQLGELARGRHFDAQTRAARAHERAEAAAAAARRATTPEGRALHEREAAIHQHAATVHESAVELQQEHIAHLERSHGTQSVERPADEGRSEIELAE